MQIECKLKHNLETIIEKSIQELGIIRYKTSVSKILFNYSNYAINYSFILSIKYGIHIFVSYPDSIEELEDNLASIIDSYDNFAKVAHQQLSKLEIRKKYDITIHAHFPNLGERYFTANLFSNTITNEAADYLKEEIPNICSNLSGVNEFIKIVKSSKHIHNNFTIGNKENNLEIISILTNDTCADMAELKGLSGNTNKNSRLENMLKRFELDEDQIREIETKNSENRIILAEAGTGKSVILFAKAQRIAALNPGNRILMLAYNKYLVEETKRKREFENIKESEMYIFTLDKFLQNLVSKHCPEKKFDSYDKDAEIESLNHVIDQIDKYDAIYIDEIQQFESNWIDFIFNLLKSHEKEKYSFVICGDINQSSSNSKKIPSWKKADLPSFQGRRISLQKKYRSTESINRFNDELVKNIYTLYSRNKLEIMSELEGEETYRITKRENDELIDLTESEYEDVCFFTTRKEPYNAPEDGETLRDKDILDKLKQIQNDGHDLREFIILYPAQKCYGKEYIKQLEEQLKESEIDFYSTREQQDLEDSSEEYITYEKIKNHLTITTIDRCVGLDFKYVVVIGLDTLGTNPNRNRRNSRYEQDIKNLDYEIFRRHISLLYVALTRAKHKLFVEIPGNFVNGQKDNMFRKIILGDIDDE